MGKFVLTSLLFNIWRASAIWEELNLEALGGVSKQTGQAKVWDNAAVKDEFEKALNRIASASIVYEPFPHLVVERLFSTHFYKKLMKELPDPSQYEVQSYAGTKPTYHAIQVDGETDGVCQVPKDCSRQNETQGACYKRKVQLHDDAFSTGRALTAEAAPSRYPFWIQAFRFVHSVNFTSLLTAKFSLPGGLGIPLWKREHIAGASLRNTAALRIEPTEYHLTPHIDLAAKVVTWQFFHPTGTQLANRKLGTFFYRPKKASFTMNDRANPPWLDYSLFDRVLEHPVLPNYFFAFAPNTRSFHGANITREKWIGIDDTMQRRTFLGFVTSEKDGFHHFNRNDWLKQDYYI